MHTVAKKTQLSLEEMAQELERGLSSREWLVTGQVLIFYLLFREELIFYLLFREGPVLPRVVRYRAGMHMYDDVT